ncbi:hypothetical protein KHQ81_01585 [Mycoplasmatota bacterium]|nr:hypothetical protein KHQ81_01585 [Mycoplasmatota bacterium]
MSDNNKEDKPMTANTVEKILKQDQDIVKALKEKPKSNYAQMYKKIIKNKNSDSIKK